MRTRNLKPGFFKNELLCALPPLNRLLFAGLWLIADRSGRIEERLARIKAELLPYDECRGRASMEQMLQRLHDAGFIRRYSVNGTKYIQILAFAKHQNPHPKEAQSIIPAPVNTPQKPLASNGLDTEIPLQAGPSPVPSFSYPPSPLPSSYPSPGHPSPSSQHSESPDTVRTRANGKAKYSVEEIAKILLVAKNQKWNTEETNAFIERGKPQ